MNLSGFIKMRFFTRDLVFVLILPLSIIPAKNSYDKLDQTIVPQILKSSGEYCRRLDQAALDFVCLEEVKEEFMDVIQVFEYSPMLGQIVKENNVTREHKYLYDYQFVRKEDRKIEKRILLSQSISDRRGLHR
jgi:hypothetical protein